MKDKDEKILLIEPSLERIYYDDFGGRHQIPNTILGLGSFLNERGIPVKIFSMSYETDYNRELEEKVLRDYLNKKNPKIVGFTSYTGLYDNVKKLATIVRDFNPNIKIIIGGHHAMHQPVEVLKTELFDAVFIGEGEKALEEYSQKVFSDESTTDILGIAFLDDKGKVIINPTRARLQGEEIPTPDYSLLPKELAKHSNKWLITSRGCPYNCSFCSSNTQYGRKVVTRPLSSVKEEIENLAKEYGTKELMITDSTFQSRPDFEEFMEILKDLNNKHGIKYTAQTRADSIVNKPEQLKMMKDSGVTSLTIGAESASQKVLEAMNKRSYYRNVPKALKLIQESGIEAGTYWLVGHPGSSAKEERKTKNAIQDLLERKLSDHYEVKIFIPFPGTKSSKDTRIAWSDSNFSNFKFDSSTPVYSLNNFPAKEIKKAYLEIMETLDKYGKKNADLDKKDYQLPKK